jgi:hypothetical protein
MQRFAVQFVLFCLFMWLFGLPLSSAMQLSAAPDDPGVIALSDYWQLVTDTRVLVAELAKTGAAPQPRVSEMAERWQQINVVISPAGERMAVDHAFVVAQLRADSSDWARLQGLLSTLLEVAQQWPPVQHAVYDPTMLERIFALPEFQSIQPELPGWLRWLAEQGQRFLEWLERLLPDGPRSNRGPGAAPSLLEQLITLVMLLLLGGLLAYALRGILADFAAEAVLPEVGDGAGEPLTADRALRRAQELSSGGDYRSAVRYLYLSTLLRLEEHGLLRYERSLTNREYLRRVAHDPKLAAVLRDVVDVFDQVWYGYHPLDESAYQRYATAVEALKNYR